jgi:hypothetical protein
MRRSKEMEEKEEVDAEEEEVEKNERKTCKIHFNIFPSTSLSPSGIFPPYFNILHTLLIYHVSIISVSLV